MGKTILFSPVGGTDPISNDNARDGALLHCCRVYKPEQVYMYMSKWTIDNEVQDSRYSFCINKLNEHLGINIICERIDRPDLIEVQDFNYFYDDFRVEINRIMQSMSDDDKLLINTSSGSPAMKSALVVLTTLGDIDATLVQVSTPNKSINTHDHKNYDVEMLWELNEDNAEVFENRCSVIECPSLVQIKNEELLKKLIDSYDYVAAVDVANMMPSKNTESFLYMLEYAGARLKLAKSDMSNIEKAHRDVDFLPIRNQEFRDVTEYALSLFVKKEREEYADFIRGLTPLVVQLYMLVLKNGAGVDVLKYCNVDYSQNTVVWDIGKLNGDEIGRAWLEIWRNRYTQAFKPRFINSDSLLALIENECDSDTFKCSDRLREVEQKIRNVAAHEISIITDERVKKMTGYTCDEIIDDIKQMFKYASINMRKEDWKSYDYMNAIIIGRIGASM